MNTCEYVAVELFKKTCAMDDLGDRQLTESELISMIPDILYAAGHDKKMVSFIVNEEDFLGDTLDAYAALV